MPLADRETIIRLYDGGTAWHVVVSQTGWSKTAVFNVLAGRAKHFPNRGRKRGMATRAKPKSPPPCRSGPWSLDEDCRLLRLWGWQRSHRTMAKRLRRALRDIRARLHHLRETYGLTRTDAKFIEEGVLEPKRPKQKRACLACTEPFLSDGAHHRICDKCKASAPWREGGDPLYEDTSLTIRTGGR